MRILHVIDSLRPRRGGPPLIAASLAAAQAALGHDVQLLSYAHADAAGPDDPEPIAQEIPGWNRVRHIRLPAPGYWEWLYATRAGRALQQHCASAQVVHLHRVWESLLPVAAAWCRRRGVPHIVMLNGMLHRWSLAQSPLKKRIALLLRYRRMLEGAAALHVGNDAERRAVLELGLRTRLVQIPNGIWPSTFDPGPRHSFRRVHPELGDAPFMLFMGRLHHKKGPDILVDAFALLHQRLPEARLVIAGDDSGARADIERHIASAGLGDRAFLAGPVYGTDKSAALAEAACFCLPSRQEGFPVAVLEAMAAGLPVLISRECYMPEVQSEGAGFVLPLSAAEFALAMEQVLNDEAMRCRMGARGRALVQNSYTWPKIAQQMLDVYASLAGP